MGQWYTRETVIVMTGNPQQLVASDPNRITLVVHSIVGSGQTISTRPDVSGQTGLRFNNVGDTLEFPWSRMGWLCRVEWYCQGTGGDSLTVIEELFREQGDGE